MTTYSKITDFAAKDALLTGNPSKIVKGTEIGAEFDSIATADASNVKGPTSAVTDNAVVRWDTTTGRISQGSSVTIDDSGNISGTSFTGAHNGTVGATTPSTGAFTTLSASSTVASTDYGTFKGLRIGLDGANDIYAAASTINYSVNTSYSHAFRVNSALIGAFSATGLAVTGALSATGNAQLGSGSTSAVYIGLWNAGIAKIGIESSTGGALATGSSAYSTVVGANATQSVQIAPNGTVSATFDTSGNLGLGVTPSAWGTGRKAIQLGGATTNNFVGSANTIFGTNFYHNGTNNIYQNTDFSVCYVQTTGQHQWFTAPSGTAGNAITFTQAMTLDSSGNWLLNNTTATGTPTTGFTAIINGGASYFNIGHITGTGSGIAYQQYSYNGGIIGSVTQSGTTAVLYNTTSDYRLKTVIAPVSGAGARIDALNPVEYEWKADGTRTRGFLAHEFQSVYAQSVNGTKDAVDADGNPVYQSMQAGSSEVIADLVAEIKSLRARLAAAGIA